MNHIIRLLHLNTIWLKGIITIITTTDHKIKFKTRTHWPRLLIPKVNSGQLSLPTSKKCTVIELKSPLKYWFVTAVAPDCVSQSNLLRQWHRLSLPRWYLPIIYHRQGNYFYYLNNFDMKSRNFALTNPNLYKFWPNNPNFDKKSYKKSKFI